MSEPDKDLPGWSEDERRTWHRLGALKVSGGCHQESDEVVHLLCPIVIGGKDILAVIDTGATRSLVGKQVELNLKKEDECNETFISANGGTIHARRLITVEMKCGNIQKDQTLRVVDIQLPVVLGLDWLNSNQCEIDFSNQIPKIRFPNHEVIECIQPCQDVLYPLKQTVRHSKFAVIAKERTKVKSGHISMLKAETKVPPPDAIIGWYRGLDNTDLFSPPALLPLNSLLYVGVSNLSNKAIYIKPGRILGYVTWSPNPVDIKEILQYTTESPALLSTVPIYYPAQVTNLPIPVATEIDSDVQPTDHFDLVELRSRVSDDEYEKAIQLLKRYEAVWNPKHPLSSTKLVEMKIDLVDNKPFYLPPYNTSPEGRAYVQSEVEKMEGDGVIRKSVSPWGSPILLVPKADGTWRFCIDFRKLNKVTIVDAYPMPKMEDILQRAAGHKWYSTMDERTGFWQVAIANEDIPKSAFVTPDGHYEWLRMPFGLVNAPATFQRITDALLAGIKWQFCAGYIDDIVIWSDSYDEHLRNVEEILQRMQRSGIQLKAKKCSLFQSKVKCLGSIIDENGIRMDPKRVQAMQDLPTPIDKDMLRSALGTLGYYQKFILNYASIASPLTKMTREKEPFVWTKECQQAYEQLKAGILNNAILAVPVIGQPYILDTDACANGIAAVLSQEINGIERPILFLSRKLSDLESRTHPQVEREMLAVVWAVDKLQHYLVQPFTLRSDCRSLSWIYNQTKGRLGRWAALLSGYRFTFLHREGKKHGNVDGLSRMSLPSDGTELTLEHYATVAACLVRPQPSTAIITEELLNDHWPEDELVKSYFEGDTSIERRHTRFYKAKTDRIYIPRSLRLIVLYQGHDRSGAHVGRNKTWSRISPKFWWPHLRRDIDAYVDSCLHCRRVKAGRERSQGFLQPIRVKATWDIVGIDLFGPLPRTRDGNRFVIVLIDHVTKFVVAEATEQVNSEIIVRFLDKYFTIFGFPRALLSDRGPQFVSWITKEYCKAKGIAKIFTTAYHPQGDGVAEAYMKFLGNGIKTLSLQVPAAWDTYVNQICWAHRTSLHPSICNTPFHAMFGRDPCDSTENLTKEVIDWKEEECRRLADTAEVIQRTQAKICESLASAQDRWALQANKHRQILTVQVGDLVLKRLHQVRKLDPRWSEPCRVIEVYWNNKVLFIKNTISGRKETINVENVRKVNVRMDEEEEEEFVNQLLDTQVMEAEVQEIEDDEGVYPRKDPKKINHEGHKTRTSVMIDDDEIDTSLLLPNVSEKELPTDTENISPASIQQDIEEVSIQQDIEEVSITDPITPPITAVEQGELIQIDSSDSSKSKSASGLDDFIHDTPSEEGALAESAESSNSFTSMDSESPLRD